MAAHADDLRYYYSEHLGQTTEVACSGVVATSPALEPGRYIARVRGAAGAARIWLRLEGAASAAAPSTPFEIGGTVADAASVRAANAPLCTFIVRGTGPNQLSAILDAGTATLVLTKISRDKG
jgi:hypothetical protein